MSSVNIDTPGIRFLHSSIYSTEDMDVGIECHASSNPIGVSGRN